jgi:oligogalacturonide lyase
MPSNARLTRRALLTAAGTIIATRAQTGSAVPPEFKRYADAATEIVVSRLTDPAHTSMLPAWHLSTVLRRGHALLYSNDRTGQMQVYRMDLKSGESHQLTEGDPVNASAMTLLPGDRDFACVAGRSLVVQAVKPARPREIYRTPDEFEPTGGLTVSSDGMFAVIAEKSATKSRLRKVLLNRGSTGGETVAESSVEILDPMARPGGNEVLYRQNGNELRLAPSGRLLVTTTGPAIWSPDGASVLYLSIPTDPAQPNTIRTFDVATRKDSLVSNTSRFVSFGRNADASVFVGASASKASPAVLLLLRSVRRELTLCEHRASNPALVMPRFTPDSQRVLFQSDKNGHMAIYAVNVERFVEQTDD